MMLVKSLIATSGWLTSTRLFSILFQHMMDWIQSKIRKRWNQIQLVWLHTTWTRAFLLLMLAIMSTIPCWRRRWSHIHCSICTIRITSWVEWDQFFVIIFIGITIRSRRTSRRLTNFFTIFIGNRAHTIRNYLCAPLRKSNKLVRFNDNRESSSWSVSSSSAFLADLAPRGWRHLTTSTITPSILSRRLAVTESRGADEGRFKSTELT